MAQRSNAPETQSPSLKFLHEIFSTKSKSLKQETAPKHTTLVSPIEPMTQSFEASALSPQLKDRTKKFAIPFSRSDVKDDDARSSVISLHFNFGC